MFTPKPTVLNANVANVHIGTYVIEGLQFEDKTFGIAVAQAAGLFQIPLANASRDFRAMLGANALFKVKTNREAVEGKRVRSAENAMSLPNFERLLRKLDKAGNVHAGIIFDALLGLTVNQVFNDTFGKPFKRQQYLLDKTVSKR